MDIFLNARILSSPLRGSEKYYTQLAKYPHVLDVKPSNKMYILQLYCYSEMVWGLIPFAQNTRNFINAYIYVLEVRIVLSELLSAVYAAELTRVPYNSPVTILIKLWPL